MAIIAASVLISGSLIFLGTQIASRNSGADSVALENIKKLLSQNEKRVPSAPERGPAAEVKPVDLAQDHIRGDLKAPLSVIEYSDFECPFCKRAHAVFQQLLDQNKGKINWVYRHYPLGFHDPLSTKESLATECAAEQGANDSFWKYADLIFKTTTSNGNGMSADDLPKLASQIGLSQEKFTDCLSSEKYKTRIQQDIAEGSAAGVDGTPGNFVLNNKTGKSEAISGAQPLSVFQAAIDRLLAQ